MKKFTPQDIIMIAFAIMIVYVIGVTVTSMVVMKMPTTEANAGIRGMIWHTIDTIVGALIGGAVVKKYDDTKNDKQ